MTVTPLALAPAELLRLDGAVDGGLRLVLDLAGAESRCEALDDHDQSLRRSKRLLIAGPAGLWLLHPAGLGAQAADAARFAPALAPGAVAAGVADISPLRRLSPIWSGVVRHGRLAALDDEGKTRVRADVLLLTPEAAAPMALVAPQAMRGYRPALDRLLARLAGAGARPYAAEAPGALLWPGEDIVAARPRITAEMPVFGALCALIRAEIAEMRRNEAGIVADLDTEFLHGYRVALRRIRSALSLLRGGFSPGPAADLGRRFSALMAPTGRLRDLDVALLDRADYAAMLPPTFAPGLGGMFDLIARDRDTAHRALAAHLRAPGYISEIMRLERLFETGRLIAAGPAGPQPYAVHAGALLWKRYRRCRRAAAALRPDTPDADVHALRIQIKKLRYLLDFARPAFPGVDFAALQRPVKRLQDVLGRFNDAAVQLAHLRALVDGLPHAKRGRPHEIAQTAGALMALLHQHGKEERARVEAAVAGLIAAETRAAYRAAFAPGAAPAED